MKMYRSAVTIAQATSWTYNEHLHNQSWICAIYILQKYTNDCCKSSLCWISI